MKDVTVTIHNMLKGIKRHFLRHKSRSKKGTQARELEHEDILEIQADEEQISVSCQDLWSNHSCKKDPGHERFIPLEKFHLECLPNTIQSEKLLSYIHFHSNLVVKICVKKENGSLSFATGYAWCGSEMFEFVCNGKNKYHSQCSEVCHGGIVIYTNQHVILNDCEAKSSEVEFSFDGRLISAYGVGLRENRNKKDLVGLKVFSHEKDLFEKIRQFSENVANTWDEMPMTIQESFKKHAVVISHPHGSVKVISVGNLITLEEQEVKEKQENQPINTNDNNNGVLYDMTSNVECLRVTRYDTATCDGSSGAPVLTGFYPYRPFTHSRHDPNKKQNYCLSY